VRTRFDNGWQKTRGNLQVKKIVNVAAQFPLLHAFGVGFDQFRSIPEARRSQCMDYARYMLAYELDDEIDAAAAFLKAIGINTLPRDDSYVRSEYLAYLYSFWRKGSEKYPSVMPIGVFGMAALVLNSKMRIVESYKPHFLVSVTISKRKSIEEFLQHTTKFESWPDEDVLFQF
jgi:hypothetical protein